MKKQPEVIFPNPNLLSQEPAELATGTAELTQQVLEQCVGTEYFYGESNRIEVLYSIPYLISCRWQLHRRQHYLEVSAVQPGAVY